MRRKVAWEHLSFPRRRSHDRARGLGSIHQMLLPGSCWSVTAASLRNQKGQQACPLPHRKKKGLNTAPGVLQGDWMITISGVPGHLLTAEIVSADVSRVSNNAHSQEEVIR